MHKLLTEVIFKDSELFVTCHDDVYRAYYHGLKLIEIKKNSVKPNFSFGYLNSTICKVGNENQLEKYIRAILDEKDTLDELLKFKLQKDVIESIECFIDEQKKLYDKKNEGENFDINREAIFKSDINKYELEKLIACQKRLVKNYREYVRGLGEKMMQLRLMSDYINIDILKNEIPIDVEFMLHTKSDSKTDRVDNVFVYLDDNKLNLHFIELKCTRNAILGKNKKNGEKSSGVVDHLQHINSYLAEKEHPIDVEYLEKSLNFKKESKVLASDFIMPELNDMINNFKYDIIIGYSSEKNQMSERSAENTLKNLKAAIEDECKNMKEKYGKNVSIYLCELDKECRIKNETLKPWPNKN